MADEQVPVAAFGVPSEAHAARQALEAAGIRSRVVGEHGIADSDRFGAAGIELRVADADAERAIEILERIGNVGVVEERDEVYPEAIPTGQKDDLVTLSTYDSPIEARLALDLLREAGIKAALADAELVAMDWLMSQAIGGIKLQVLRSDLLAAERVLQDRGRTQEPPEPKERQRSEALPEAITEAPTTAMTREPPPSVLAAPDGDDLNPTEETLIRASIAALYGLLLFPLQLYALVLLVNVASSSEDVRPEHRWRLIVSWALCVPSLALMLVVLRFFLVRG